MASPLAHGAIGIAVGVLSPWLMQLPFCKTVLQRLAGCVFLACLPDIDIIFSLLVTGSLTALHFTFTHTAFFAMAVALVALMLAGRNAAALVFLLVLSHVIVDGLTGPVLGFSNAVGIAAFAPLNSTILVSPVTLFRGVYHAQWISWHNVITVFSEFSWVIVVSLIARKRLQAQLNTTAP